jgi:hypothetical protein
MQSKVATAKAEIVISWGEASMTPKIKKSKATGVVTPRDAAIRRAVEIAQEVHDAANETSGTILADAAAVTLLRDQMNRLMPASSPVNHDWRISDVISLLHILNIFIQNSMSEIKYDSNHDADFIIEHQSASLLSNFILTLEDLRKGIIDEHLKGPINYAGNSLKMLETKNIGSALLYVDILRMEKNMRVEDARKLVAKVLQKSGFRVGKKQVTANRLEEWAKDYDLSGNKKKGK